MDSHESYFKSFEGALGFERSELSYKFEMQEKMIEMVEVSIVFFHVWKFKLYQIGVTHWYNFLSISV
jgi:hypothetical protein